MVAKRVWEGRSRVVARGRSSSPGGEWVRLSTPQVAQPTPPARFEEFHVKRSSKPRNGSQGGGWGGERRCFKCDNTENAKAWKSRSGLPMGMLLLKLASGRQSQSWSSNKGGARACSVS
jgi:hypothetical protein